MLHPIVAQMHPSLEQKPAIRERGRDIAVTAGAGAGKTRTLVARYLSLLADGQVGGQARGLFLRGVVAITFTRKAAREMRNRIREEVRRYLERTDLSPAERDRWQTLYTGLDAARIDTIHSLCTEILRAHPAEARVDPRFEVLEEGQANILRRRAVDEALAWATDDREAVGLFGLLGEWELKRTLDALLGQWLEVEGVFGGPDELPWRRWEAALSSRLRAFVDDGRVGSAFRQLLALRVDGTLDRAEARGDRLAAPLRRLLALWDEIVAARQAGDWLSVSVRLAPLRQEMKQKGRAANWLPADPKAIIRELQAAYDDALDAWVGKGISLDRDKELAEAMPALRRSFETALAFYRRMKQERQALDFDDLEGSALALLQENLPVRRRWQAEVKAILVDEFQDTNGRQRDLAALLNGDGGKLFVVGDAKQSIYRFRGADVTVFRAERERIERAGGAVFALETSYRAHRDLIQGLNDLLRPVLGEVADPDRPWAEPFAPLRHYRREPGPDFLPPYIELHLTVGTKGAGALDRAADALVGRIVELMESGAQVQVGAGLPPAQFGAGLAPAQIEAGVEQGQHRPLDYGDVAILCRASSSFSAYEDALERAGVPFLTVAGRGFYGRPEIRDLLNGLQALDDPTDDLALAGLLRSPAFALSDAALYDLCQGRGRDGGSTSLWDVLCGTDGGLSGEDRARAGRAARAIADLHGWVGRMPVADLLKAFLDATDYRAALIQAGQSRGARNVAKLLADAHASGIVGVGEFLEYVGSLRDSGTREGEARTTAEGAVQVMTVHAAKGLEFPVVVIGDAAYRVGRRHSVLVDPDLGVLLPLPDEQGQVPGIYRLGKVNHDDKEEAESDRLLYVAATRAREKLILNGCVSLTKDGRVGKPKGWLGKVAGPDGLRLTGKAIAYDGEGADALGLDLQVGQTPVACTFYEPGYRWDGHANQVEGETESKAVLLPPPLLAPVSPGVERADQRTREQDRIPPQRVWRVVPAVRRPRVPAWVVGALVHEALAAWRFPDDAASTGPGQRFECWAEARARGHGVTDSQQLADAVRRSRQLLVRFQAHPLYSEMDGADRRLHEVPYSRTAGGHVESGVIDALYLRAGVWTVVEFKTDDVRDEAELEALLKEEDYLAQAERYVAAVEELLGQRPQAWLCMLNYAGAVRLYPLP